MKRKGAPSIQFSNLYSDHISRYLYEQKNHDSSWFFIHNTQYKIPNTRNASVSPIVVRDEPS